MGLRRCFFWKGETAHVRPKTAGGTHHAEPALLPHGPVEPLLRAPHHCAGPQQLAIRPDDLPSAPHLCLCLRVLLSQRCEAHPEQRQRPPSPAGAVLGQAVEGHFPALSAGGSRLLCLLRKPRLLLLLPAGSGRVHDSGRSFQPLLLRYRPGAVRAVAPPVPVAAPPVVAFSPAPHLPGDHLAQRPVLQ